MSARAADRGISQRKAKPAAVISVRGNAYSVAFTPRSTTHDPLRAQADLVAVLDALLAKARTGQLCGLIWIAEEFEQAGSSRLGVVGSYRTQRARAANALAEAAGVMRPERIGLVRSE